MRFRSKRYKKDAELAPRGTVPIDAAVQQLKTFSKTKFDQSVDLVMHLGIDARQADQAIRGSISLPKGIGASKRVIAFCAEGDVPAAKAAGAVEAGGDELIEKVQKGWTDFDVAIAHPSLMGKVGRLGRVLGPQGKMPSPKSGTVTPDVATAVKEYAAGKVEFRNDAGGNVHAVVGKLSFAPEDLKANILAFVDHIRRMKPASAKGTYVKKICISGTMTPGIHIDAATVVTE
ncbi:MAG: 50S ribosomal protein L1 [Planctomycetota bacterium]